MSIETQKTSAGRIRLGNIEYDILVNYSGKNGVSLPCKKDFTIKPDLQKELQQLIATIATAHARQAGKPFKDLKVIQLNNLGATFETKETQSHDFDLTPEEKSTFAPPLSYNKVQDLWTKTSNLLVHTYQEAHPTKIIKVPLKTENSPQDPSQPNASDEPTTVVTLAASEESEKPPAYEPPMGAALLPSAPPFPSETAATTPPATFSDLARKHAKALKNRLWKKTPPTQPADLGREYSGENAPALEQSRQALIESQLTLSSPPSRSFKEVIQRKPAALPTLPPLEESAISTCIEETVDAASSYGFKGQVLALNEQYKALQDHLEKIGQKESTTAEKIGRMFRNRLNELAKMAAIETTRDEDREEILRVVNNPTRPLGNIRPTLTLSSFQLR